MYVRGTEKAAGPNGPPRARRGSALIATLVVFVGLFGIVYVTTAASVGEADHSRASFDEVRVEYLAQAGVARAKNLLDQAAKKDPLNPLSGVVNVFGGAASVTPYLGEVLIDAGRNAGAYSVTITATQITNDSVTVQIDATGYLPDAPANLQPGEQLTAWHSVSATYQYELDSSEVFNYAYFINNWGWFYGNTIYCNGNARSNGQFDAAGYAPTITGQPLYDEVLWSGGVPTLSGYRDDNLDGLEDGNDGGTFSGWDIVAAQNVKGNGGLASNQHDFQDPVEMPNLSDLSYYEQKAASEGGRIQVGGSTVTNAVYGDEAGERQHLYLEGTAADPIVLDGPVVVRGDVIIHGYVTGQGAIYAGGNIYVPDSVRYVDPPATQRPADNTQTQTEAWLQANKDKDFLGLFAKENIVVGDHTDSTWSYYVGGWMGSPLNSSKEDAGEDGIPNTLAGRDGILGTADDDVLEGDGVFTVEYYSAADAALGLIPPGFNVGDAIPGSGEDIDGDGSYDGTIGLADIQFQDPLTTSKWGGNMPAGGVPDYSTIATLYAAQLDAVFYTNHSFSWVVVGGTPAEINGALISRNENIVYGTPSVSINYDCRLLGGNTGVAGDLLPQTMKPAQLIRWRRLEADPNRYAQP